MPQERELRDRDMNYEADSIRCLPVIFETRMKIPDHLLESHDLHLPEWQVSRCWWCCKVVLFHDTEIIIIKLRNTKWSMHALIEASMLPNGGSFVAWVFWLQWVAVRIWRTGRDKDLGSGKRPMTRLETTWVVMTLPAGGEVQKLLTLRIFNSRHPSLFQRSIQKLTRDSTRPWKWGTT